MTNRSALSPHILFSEFRGPRILNELIQPTPAAAPVPPKEGETPNPEPAPAANPPKPEETEGRITQLAQENKELKAWKKEQERLKKEAEDKALQEAGEHQKLAEQYKNESASEKAAREAAEAKVAMYEERMKKQIDAQLKGITDAEKQKKVREMLGDRPVDEQAEMLENILSLVGVTPTSFGGPTPVTTVNPDQTTEAAKQKRFDDLVTKEIAEGLTSPERQEKHKLMKELSSFFKS